MKPKFEISLKSAPLREEKKEKTLTSKTAPRTAWAAAADGRKPARTRRRRRCRGRRPRRGWAWSRTRGCPPCRGPGRF